MSFFGISFVTISVSVHVAALFFSGCNAIHIPSSSAIDDVFQRSIPTTRIRSLRGKTTKKNKQKKEKKSVTSDYFHAYPNIVLNQDDESSDEDLFVSSARIINGHDASQQYRQFILLLNGNTPVGCGAVLIDENHVLTAAHCMAVTINRVYINAYSPWNGNAGYPYQVEDVSEIFVHPGYDERTFDNDFAILKLRNEISNEFSPIALPSVDTTYTTEDDFTVLGFGRMSNDISFSSILQETNVGYVPTDQCRNIPGFRETVKDSMLCAGGGNTDSCTGDSGGPLIKKTRQGPELVGIVSWGYGCATIGMPGVYGRVQSALAWIREIMCSDSNSKFCNQALSIMDDMGLEEVNTVSQEPTANQSSQRGESCTSISGDYTYQQVKNGKTKQKTRSCDWKNTAKLCEKSTIVMVDGESLPLVEVCPEQCEASWCV